MLFSIKFRLRNQNYNPKTNLTPINCRLTINGITAPDFFTGIRCNPKKWDVKRQCITGRSNEVIEDNKSLDNIRTDLKKIINDMKENDTSISIRKRYLEKDIPPPTLTEIFEKYIVEEKESLNGTDNELNPKTIEKWYYSLNHLKRFVGENFKLSNLKKGFENQYYRFLIKGNLMKNDHAVRNVSYLNTVLDYAVQENYLFKNPLTRSLLKKDKPKEISYLKPHIVEKIENLKLESEFKESIDLFLFICYTSMDNNELRVLDKDKHIFGDTIVIMRGKTKKYSSKQIIPILPKTKSLLEKYNYQLPVHHTYTFNRYLKVIKSMLNINELTTKVGRKTAGMFFLTNSVPIEVVSRIMGHKSVKTTQKYYADILESEIVLDKTKHLM